MTTDTAADQLERDLAAILGIELHATPAAPVPTPARRRVRPIVMAGVAAVAIAVPAVLTIDRSQFDLRKIGRGPPKAMAVTTVLPDRAPPPPVTTAQAGVPEPATGPAPQVAPPVQAAAVHGGWRRTVARAAWRPARPQALARAIAVEPAPAAPLPAPVAAPALATAIAPEPAPPSAAISLDTAVTPTAATAATLPPAPEPPRPSKRAIEGIDAIRLLRRQ